ncbi:MAG: hypothetical protein V4683_04670 [Bacteroidota bacterium]
MSIYHSANKKIKDRSFELYNKYYSINNNEVIIQLSNNETIKGKLKGYFRGDTTINEPFISKWHLDSTNYLLGTDAYGYLNGQLINQVDIVKITFMEDNTTMMFNQTL